MDVQSLNDKRLSNLAEQANVGDEQAVRELFRALLPRVRNLVRYLVRNDRDLDDLSQDALVCILRGLPSYTGHGSFRSWSDRVVARSVFAGLRRRERQATERPSLAVPDEVAGRQLDAPDSEPDRREAVRLLDELPVEQRQAMVLHHTLGYSLPELAEEFGVSVETCRSRLRLGKKKLRGLMDQESPKASQMGRPLVAVRIPPRASKPVLRSGG